MDLDTYKHGAIPGSPLAEVFSVIINLDNDDEECELYGTIKIDDDEGSVYAYNVGPGDSETICANESLFLSNRDCAILASSQFTVYFDLKDKDGDVEFIRNSFCWNATDGYNRCLVRNVRGKQGSATVYYTVHSVALEAHISAEFIKGETEKSTAHIYGKLVARYKGRYDRYANQDAKEHSQIAVFESGVVEVDDGDIFLLDRPVVTFPSYTSLVVGVYFCRSEDDQVLWNDEVEFFPGEVDLGTTHKDVQATCGVIRVSVYACNYVESSFTQVQMRKDWMREIGILYKY